MIRTLAAWAAYRRATGRTWAARLHERRKRRLARRAAAGDVARRGLPPRPGSGW